jgi:hypothetical protein
MLCEVEFEEEAYGWSGFLSLFVGQSGLLRPAVLFILILLLLRDFELSAFVSSVIRSLEFKKVLLAVDAPNLSVIVLERRIRLLLSLVFERCRTEGFVLFILLLLELVSSGNTAQLSRHLFVVKVSESDDVHLIVKIRRESEEKSGYLEAVGDDELSHKI